MARAQPLWDIAGTAGLFAGHRPGSEGGGYHEEWFQAVQGGIVAGRYLSEHLKVEIEGSATGGGEQYLSRRIVVPDHKEVAKGTLRAIIRQVGLTVDEFLDLL